MRTCTCVQVVIILRGLPGSGKGDVAKALKVGLVFSVHVLYVCVCVHVLVCWGWVRVSVGA